MPAAAAGRRRSRPTYPNIIDIGFTVYRKGLLMKRQLALILATGLLVSGCGASTAGGATTCKEWMGLNLSTEEALSKSMSGEVALSDEQKAILKDALKSADLATSSSNMTFASANLLQYCGADGTGTRPNANKPISGALK